MGLLDDVIDAVFGSDDEADSGSSDAAETEGGGVCGPFCYRCAHFPEEPDASPGSVARGHSGASEANTFDDVPPIYSYIESIVSVDAETAKAENGATWALGGLADDDSGIGLSGLAAGIGGAAAALAGVVTDVVEEAAGAISAAVGAVVEAIW
jgi:hypothetical protein